MNANETLSQLKQRRDRLDAAISALEDITPSPRRGREPGRHMSAAARARIAAAQRKRWAEHKRKNKAL